MTKINLNGQQDTTVRPFNKSRKKPQTELIQRIAAFCEPKYLTTPKFLKESYTTRDMGGDGAQAPHEKTRNLRKLEESSGDRKPRNIRGNFFTDKRVSARFKWC